MASYINRVTKENRKFGLSRRAAKKWAARCDRARIRQLAAIKAAEGMFEGGSVPVSPHSHRTRVFSGVCSMARFHNPENRGVLHVIYGCFRGVFLSIYIYNKEQ